jgi:bifunctional DNA-binding transcriptional regulator/antitoxin component of YhaV-PrlF toxin-antitoxin module
MDGWLDCHTEKVKTVNKLGQLVIPDILRRDLILSLGHIIDDEGHHISFIKSNSEVEHSHLYGLGFLRIYFDNVCVYL